MPPVSLIDIGVILGRTTGQDVNLGSLRADGYTRDYATDGYYVVNPFEVFNGNADDPARADDLHYLGNWLGYDHDRLPAGSDLEDLGGYGAANLQWSRPPGFAEEPTVVGVRIYAKSTGLSVDSVPGETETSTDPTDSPDTTDTAGFGATFPSDHEISLATSGGEWVAITVLTIFDDSDTVHEDSEGYSARVGTGETPLTGAFEGILAQVWDTAPTIDDVDQDPAPGDCFTGTAEVDIIIDVRMDGSSEGTLQRSTDGGSNWTTVDSNVTAGASSLTDPDRDTGETYTYRLRYNDVSPNEWSNEASHFAECTQI